jgi:hypothetical protein
MPEFFYKPGRQLLQPGLETYGIASLPVGIGEVVEVVYNRCACHIEHMAEEIRDGEKCDIASVSAEVAQAEFVDVPSGSFCGCQTQVGEKGSGKNDAE